MFLRLVDRTTRVSGTRVVPDPRGALRSASETLTRDLSAAAAGALSPAESIRPVHDNARDEAVLDVNGTLVTIRSGTDSIELRGVLRFPLFSLDVRDRETRALFSSPLSGAHPGSLQKSLSNAALRIYVYPGRENPRRLWISKEGSSGGFGKAWAVAGSPVTTASPDVRPGVANERFDSSLAALRKETAGPKADRYFVVQDAEGAFAVGRVLSFDGSRLSIGCSCDAPVAPSSSACPPGAFGCFVEIHLDFTDRDAVALNRGGDPRAPERLGPLVAGGLFDRIIYFVANGELGHAPDYLEGTDPPSLRFPHPYLASAHDRGQGRFEISRVADDIEDLQILYLTDTERSEASSFVQGVSAAAWHEAPIQDPSPGILVDAFGRARLKRVRVALVAKNGERMRPGEAFAGAGGKAVSLEGRDGYWLWNAPRPEDDRTMPGPIGWSADAMRRVPFLRRFVVFDIPIPELNR